MPSKRHIRIYSRRDLSLGWGNLLCKSLLLQNDVREPGMASYVKPMSSPVFRKLWGTLQKYRLAHKGTWRLKERWNRSHILVFPSTCSSPVEPNKNWNFLCSPVKVTSRWDFFKMLVSCCICGHRVLADLFAAVQTDASNNQDCSEALPTCAKQLRERLDFFWVSIEGIKAVEVSTKGISALVQALLRTAMTQGGNQAKIHQIMVNLCSSLATWLEWKWKGLKDEIRKWKMSWWDRSLLE